MHDFCATMLRQVDSLQLRLSAVVGHRLALYTPAVWKPLRMLHTVLFPLLTQYTGIMSGWVSIGSPRHPDPQRTHIAGNILQAHCVS